MWWADSREASKKRKKKNPTSSPDYKPDTPQRQQAIAHHELSRSIYTHAMERMVGRYRVHTLPTYYICSTVRWPIRPISWSLAASRLLPTDGYIHHICRIHTSYHHNIIQFLFPVPTRKNPPRQIVADQTSLLFPTSNLESSIPKSRSTAGRYLCIPTIQGRIRVWIWITLYLENEWVTCMSSWKAYASHKDVA